MRPSLHYFQDTLCGWCYGFGPVMNRIAEEWADRLDVHVYAGGMVNVLEEAYQNVERLSGITFGDAFIHDVLAHGKLTLESVTPAKALVTFRALREHGAIPFAHRLQQALYRDGMDLSLDATYAALANEFDLDAMEFISLMHDDRVADAVQEEFDYVASLGIQAFPTVLYAVGDDAQLLAHGFTSYDDMTIRLQAVMGNIT
ncbi:MAG: DsbA family protein [Ignavibacteriae bacterium]|jgi:putative protein-disulfide isomerase|nr:MAG: DsbA family protein [Ignavibacteriota bacterium]